jgi:hypothetical protein
VSVDETGRDHVAGGVDAFRALDITFRDDDDLPVFDADVARAR